MTTHKFIVKPLHSLNLMLGSASYEEVKAQYRSLSSQFHGLLEQAGYFQKQYGEITQRRCGISVSFTDPNEIMAHLLTVVRKNEVAHVNDAFVDLAWDVARLVTQPCMNFEERWDAFLEFSKVYRWEFKPLISSYGTSLISLPGHTTRLRFAEDPADVIEKTKNQTGGIGDHYYAHLEFHDDTQEVKMVVSDVVVPTSGYPMNPGIGSLTGNGSACWLPS